MNKKILKVLKESGIELTGSGVGAIIGTTLAGPGGAVAGVVGGKAVEIGLSKLLGEKENNFIKIEDSNSMQSKNFRQIKKELCEILKSFTEESMISEFTYSKELPKNQLQYWEYEVLILSEDLNKSIRSTCGYFYSIEENMQNENGNINDFFKINDIVSNEFYYIEELSLPLSEMVNRFINLESLNKEYSVMISVNAYINNESQWTRDVCSENLLIIHLDEESSESIEISCMMSERYTIKYTRPDNKVDLLTIPFDKVKYFENFEKIE